MAILTVDDIILQFMGGDLLQADLRGYDLSLNKNEMDISSAKIIITGGSEGIGYETAKQLHAQGAQVVICSRNKEMIEKSAAEIGCIGLVCDVSDESAVKDLFQIASEKMNGFNVLINNAGVGYLAPLAETTLEDFTRVWETNVRGTFLCGREAARLFIKENTGNIINISSSAGLRGFAGATAYSASKFAVTGMTESWRAELRKHNVRVMQVNPSQVITDFSTKLGYEEPKPETKLKPAEIAHVIVAMLSMNDVGFIPGVEVWATNP